MHITVRLYTEYGSSEIKLPDRLDSKEVLVPVSGPGHKHIIPEIDIKQIRAKPHMNGL